MKFCGQDECGCGLLTSSALGGASEAPDHMVHVTSCGKLSAQLKPENVFMISAQALKKWNNYIEPEHAGNTILHCFFVFFLKKEKFLHHVNTEKGMW